MQNIWDSDRERPERDWDTLSNRSQGDNFSSRNSSNSFRAGHNNSVRNRDDRSKRFPGNRMNRNAAENNERWRADSPPSNRSAGNRCDDYRDSRQVNIKVCIVSFSMYISCYYH